MKTLQAQRDALLDTLMSTDADAFPGSKAWSRRVAAEKALAAFDAAHPEILGGARAQHAADMADSSIGRGVD